MMGPNSSVCVLLLAVVLSSVSADGGLDEAVDKLLDSSSTREANVKRSNGGALKLPEPLALPLETKSQPSRNPSKSPTSSQPTGAKSSSSYAERPQDSSKSRIKTPPIGLDKNVPTTTFHGARDSSDSNEKPLREHRPFISSDPSSRTTEKVFVGDKPMKKEESLLILKVKTSMVSQPSVGEIRPDGTSQRHSQKLGLVESKEILRASTPIPTTMTSGVSGNKTEKHDDDLVLFSLIDVPDRDEATTCAPGERWHSNRCRTAISDP